MGVVHLHGASPHAEYSVPSGLLEACLKNCPVLKGILILAKQKGLIDKVKPLMVKLRDDALFRVQPGLFDTILKMVGEADD